jgi:hypothetical protein
VPRPRRLASRTGLRSSRLIPDSAEASPLRLHSRPPLHSGRPTVTDCSTVRLTSSPAANQRQRVETPSLGSAPAKAGAHPVPPTRRGATTPAPARKARSVPPHAPGALMLGAEQRPSNKVCGSLFVMPPALRAPALLTPTRCSGASPSPRFALRRKAHSRPQHERAPISGKPSARHRARRPPASLAIRVPLRHGEGAGTATAFQESRPTSCPASIVRVTSANPPRPALLSCDLLSPARTTYLMPNMPSFGASPAPCQGTRWRHF